MKLGQKNNQTLDTIIESFETKPEPLADKTTATHRTKNQLIVCNQSRNMLY